MIYMPRFVLCTHQGDAKPFLSKKRSTLTLVGTHVPTAVEGRFAGLRQQTDFLPSFLVPASSEPPHITHHGREQKKPR